ncbi:hypothetical protein KEM52_002341, partial [Ascosphaera acerosa]
MGIRFLDDWATARGLTYTGSLEALAHTCLGIDAHHYLARHLDVALGGEPLLPALGGFPFALRAAVQREMRRLREHDITPVFVFSGLDTESQRRAGARSAARTEAEGLAAVREAWRMYATGDAEGTVTTLSRA